jgi:RNA polymerase sigma factor (TIGR02999 family)
LGREKRQGMSEIQVDRLIASADMGDATSREKLFAALYGELHRLAQRQLRRNAALTVSPTTLLHETFLNICGRGTVPIADRARFLAYAARAMRSLLVDYVRSRKAQKRGGAFEITVLPTDVPDLAGADSDLERISDALDALGAAEPRLAEIVDLKFFCGFSFAEIAEIWDVSERTAQRAWDKARILLLRHLKDRDILL